MCYIINILCYIGNRYDYINYLSNRISKLSKFSLAPHVELVQEMAASWGFWMDLFDSHLPMSMIFPAN